MSKAKVDPIVKESDDFLKAVIKLENRFPGAIETIRKGYVKVTPGKIELVRY